MPPSETEGPEHHRPTAQSKGIAWAALAVEFLWIALLVAMAIWASNPVVLNQHQVLRARDEGVIVRVRVADVQSGQCQVMQQWSAVELGDTLQVTNLEHTAAQTGESYILPLLRMEVGYIVAPGKLPDAKPMIYPDTADAISQLEELLVE